MRWILVILSFSFATPAAATVALRHDLRSLTRAADVVVVGEVTAQQAQWRGGRIVTEVEVLTRLAVKGAPGPKLRVEVLGGELDGLGQRVAGSASFVVGERVALFLERVRSRPTFRVVGLSQGKLIVTLRGGSLVVVRGASGDLTLVERRPNGTLSPAQSKLSSGLPLDDFLVELMTALEDG